MKHSNKKIQKGFTLIELMIVVAIIGVLSAIAIPAYKNYVTKSEAATGTATVRSLLTNIDMYIQETGGTFPSNATDVGGTNTMSGLGSLTWDAGKTNVTFKFTDGSLAVSGAEGTIKYTRSNNGWACTTTNIPVDAIPSGC
ncbi:prepilin-type cleavage/methylation domain-containing protein [Vibrionales bacterium C3R12]|nr:prepilin-type cleavage/methylation domain-containing protein [Vibrionales bacterium C3R12]